MTAQTTHLSWQAFDARTRELAAAYLEPSYDAIYYVQRGGLTPAHLLAHQLAVPPGGASMHPLVIRRHEDDSVQSATRAPELAGPIPPAAPGSRLLLVEDTIGAGRTLEVAVRALEAFAPAVLDVFSVGLDHADLAATRHEPGIAAIIERAVIGFDYWGWMIFPWEREAGMSVESPRAGVLEALRVAAEAGRDLDFEVFDRRAVRRPEDLRPDREYATPALLARLLAKHGYHREEATTAEPGVLRIRATYQGAPA